MDVAGNGAVGAGWMGEQHKDKAMPWNSRKWGFKQLRDVSLVEGLIFVMFSHPITIHCTIVSDVLQTPNSRPNGANHDRYSG